MVYWVVQEVVQVLQLLQLQVELVQQIKDMPEEMVIVIGVVEEVEEQVLLEQMQAVAMVHLVLEEQGCHLQLRARQ
jgi:hypothetical protein|tara:strand:- start:102 stop:329 length:228 start_codon:yes stop_codon:yes gene_type:complete